MHKCQRKFTNTILCFSLVFIPAATANTETTYITDKLEIPIRSGGSKEYRIIRYLQAGTKVEVLQTLNSGYTKIKDERGREGFLLDRYLVTTPPSLIIVGGLDALIAKQKKNIKRLRQTVKNLTQQRKMAEKKAKEIRDDLAAKELEFKNFLATAGDSITLRKRLVTLETELQGLISDNETLLAEKLAVGDDSSKTWFSLGAVTIAFGWFVGMLMPRMRKSRVDTNL